MRQGIVLFVLVLGSQLAAAAEPTPGVSGNGCVCASTDAQAKTCLATGEAGACRCAGSCLLERAERLSGAKRTEAEKAAARLFAAACAQPARTPADATQRAVGDLCAQAGRLERKLGDWEAASKHLELGCEERRSPDACFEGARLAEASDQPGLALRFMLLHCDAKGIPRERCPRGTGDPGPKPEGAMKALIQAIDSESLEQLKATLAQAPGLDLNARIAPHSTSAETTLLAYAITKPTTLEIIRALILAGAEPKNSLPLAASVHGHLVPVLLELGADPSVGNPLAAAAVNGHVEVVRLLLKAGAPLEKQGGEALAMAAFHGKAEVAHVLLVAGVDVNARHEAFTVLHWWAVSDMPDEATLRVLLQARPDVNAEDHRKRTALVLVLGEGEGKSPPTYEMVHLLLKAGADPDRKGVDGISARMLVQGHEAPNVRALFGKPARRKP